MSNELDTFITKYRNIIDKMLLKYIVSKGNKSSKLVSAMKYAVMPGGKRIRPLLTLATAKACGKKVESVLQTACAIELIHTYSLVHDDLPAMDDDDYRRGKPSLHRKFGEAVAILAGDALLSLSFKLIAENSEVKGLKKDNVIEVMKIISDAIGKDGMVSGQVMDIIMREKSFRVNRKNFEEMIKLKTACLIKASVVSAAVILDVGKEKINRLEKYGENIGLIFQITDDIIDYNKNEINYPKIFGMDYTSKKIKELLEDAKKEVSIFSKNSNILVEFAEKIVYRET